MKIEWKKNSLKINFQIFYNNKYKKKIWIYKIKKIKQNYKPSNEHNKKYFFYYCYFLIQIKNKKKVIRIALFAVICSQLKKSRTRQI